MLKLHHHSAQEIYRVLSIKLEPCSSTVVFLTKYIGIYIDSLVWLLSNPTQSWVF